MRCRGRKRGSRRRFRVRRWWATSVCPWPAWRGTARCLSDRQGDCLGSWRREMLRSMAAGVALGVGAVVDATCACAEVDVRQKESRRKAITGRRCARAKRCIAIVYSRTRAGRERSDSKGEECQLPVGRLSKIHRNVYYLLYTYFNESSEEFMGKPRARVPGPTTVLTSELMIASTSIIWRQSP